MMDAVFIKVLNMSISAGWLILAVMVMRLLLKKAPKWISVVLWGLVGLRLVLPFSLQSVFSLIPSSEVISPSIGYAQHPAINSGVSVIDNAVNPTLGDSLAATPMNSVNPMQVVLYLGGVIWAVGMAVILLYGLISYFRLRRKVAEAIPYEKNTWLCDQVKTPFILGVFRPRIYLPSGLNEEETAYVLAHEHAHLKRKDHLWKPLGFLLLTVYWFNPLVWVAYILLCRDIEAACDEKVISDMEMTEKKAYANALVSCSMQRRLILAYPLAFGEVGVKERVKGVLNYKKPAFWVIVAALIACAVIAVCFLTNPKEDDQDLSSLNFKNAIREVYEAIPAEESYSMTQVFNMGELYDSETVIHRWQAGQDWLEISEQTNGVTIRSLSYQGKQYQQMEMDGRKGAWEEADLSQMAQGLEAWLYDVEQLEDLEMDSTKDGMVITGKASLPELPETSEDVLKAERHTVMIQLDADGRLKELRDTVTYRMETEDGEQSFDMSSRLTITGYDETSIRERIAEAAREVVDEK